MTSRELSFEPLTPVAFVERAASVFADRLAVVSGERRFSYREHWNRTLRQAGLWRSLGVGADDRVGVLSPNSHVVLEAHTGVPLAGGGPRAGSHYTKRLRQGHRPDARDSVTNRSVRPWLATGSHEYTRREREFMS